MQDEQNARQQTLEAQEQGLIVRVAEALALRASDPKTSAEHLEAVLGHEMLSSPDPRSGLSEAKYAALQALADIRWVAASNFAEISGRVALGRPFHLMSTAAGLRPRTPRSCKMRCF